MNVETLAEKRKRKKIDSISRKSAISLDDLPLWMLTSYRFIAVTLTDN